MSGAVQLRTGDTEQAPGGNGGAPRRRGGRRLAWGLVSLVLLVAAGLAAWALIDVGGGEAKDFDAVPTATAEVTRRDLAQTETLSGTLGFAGSRTLVAAGPGTITVLAPEGATRRRGGVLYRVNQRPVVLLLGNLPAWRRLEHGVEGHDVKQLEQNLKAMGYDPGTVDREFDDSTEEAVENWQADLTVDETGAVEPTDIVFSPTPVRIGSHVASVGQAAQPGGEVLQVSSTTQMVSVELDATEQSLVAEGDEVTVELPDETQVRGTISAIGTIAEASVDEATGEETAATVEVTVALPDGTGTDLDQAPVDVSVVTSSAEGVLAVPVTALLALLGGGYAVEIPDGTTTRLVAVEPGMYADGYVELADGNVAEGDTVVVPQ